MSSRKFTIFAWGLVAYTVAVILWGVVVRATGSGAGCGSHWPTCNGSVLPSLAEAETAIEFVHRLTSGAMGLIVIGLVVWAWRVFPKGHRVRKAAMASLIFTIIEGLIGALLVRLELTADNTSVLRAVMIALHLANTYILLITITLTAWWSMGHAGFVWRGQPKRLTVLLSVGIILMLMLGMTGAVTALGDTLFPVESLAEGIRQDADPTSHFLIQLRVVHPLFAVFTSLYVAWAARVVRAWRPDKYTIPLSHAVGLLFFFQLAIGALNLGLLAPIWMQVIHLLMADILWVLFILLTNATFTAEWLTKAPLPVLTPSRIPSGIGY